MEISVRRATRGDHRRGKIIAKSMEHAGVGRIATFHFVIEIVRSAARSPERHVRPDVRSNNDGAIKSLFRAGA